MPVARAQSRLSALLQGLFERIESMRSSMRSRSRGMRRLMLVVSVVVFVVAMVLSYRSLPTTDRDIRWMPLAVVGLLGVPVLMMLNALEYAASAWVVGRRPTPHDAFRVAVFARAANLLPLPGSILVRSQALKTAGASYRHAFGITTAAGVLWLAAGAMCAGGWQIFLRPWLGGVMLGVGITALTAGHLMVSTISADGSGYRHTARLFTIEVAMILVKAARFWLILVGLDMTADVGAAVALTLAGVLASAVGFFPGGLGLRELLAAAIGPLVDLPAAAALLVTGLDRLIALPILALVAMVLAAMPDDRAATVGDGPVEGPAA
jgi:uncharacterized membrane protein YbhN (UPF0104 family)